jgi:hypothetical protein
MKSTGLKKTDKLLKYNCKQSNRWRKLPKSTFEIKGASIQPKEAVLAFINSISPSAVSHTESTDNAAVLASSDSISPSAVSHTKTTDNAAVLASSDSISPAVSDAESMANAAVLSFSVSI